MPVLYFIITPSGSRNSRTVWGKFGHCVNVEQRIRSYSLPSRKYASVEYDYGISMERPIDNLINKVILKKSSPAPLVNFMQSYRSNSKIDWFEISGASAYDILDYIKNLTALKSQDDYDLFAKELSAIVAADLFENSVEFLQEAMSAWRISKKSFFERNFKRGGMIPIKEMRMHPEWKEKYLDDAEVKDIHMCKSCPNRSHSGCCPEYSASNRKMIRMVIGWHC